MGVCGPRTYITPAGTRALGPAGEAKLLGSGTVFPRDGPRRSTLPTLLQRCVHAAFVPCMLYTEHVPV